MCELQVSNKHANLYIPLTNGRLVTVGVLWLEGLQPHFYEKKPPQDTTLKQSQLIGHNQDKPGITATISSGLNPHSKLQKRGRLIS